jgi:hypothetical protein
MFCSNKKYNNWTNLQIMQKCKNAKNTIMVLYVLTFYYLYYLSGEKGQLYSEDSMVRALTWHTLSKLMMRPDPVLRSFDARRICNILSYL